LARRRRPRTPKPSLPGFLFDEAGDRARSCDSKDAYPSEEHARAVMLMNGTQLSIYACRYCGMWHFTSRRE
jgi:hypothetical protein